MLNQLILYNMVMGALLLAYHQGRVIVPNIEGGGILKGIGSGIVRCWILAGFLLFGLNDIPGQGYAAWWANYSSEHSMILWFVFWVPATLILWVVWASTYFTNKSPGRYKMWGPGGGPSLHKVSMRAPAVWYVVWWAWMLFNPALPFYTCFVKIYLFRTPVSEVFPLG